MGMFSFCGDTMFLCHMEVVVYKNNELILYSLFKGHGNYKSLLFITFKQECDA